MYNKIITFGSADNENYFPYLDEYKKYSVLRRQYYQNMFFLKEKYYSYGGLNTDLLCDQYRRIGYNVALAEVCPEIDQQLELRMPDVWYLNHSKDMLGIALYYNAIQDLNERTKNLNSISRERFGSFGLIELYDIQNFNRRRSAENIQAFSVPKTLPRVAKVLESNILLDIVLGITKQGKYAHLRSYVLPALKIYQDMKKESWFKSDYFFKGILENNKYMETFKTTNIREMLKKYWQEVLVKQGIKKDEEEIIVLGKAFSSERKPDVVIQGDVQNEKFDHPGLLVKMQYSNATILRPHYKDGHLFSLVKRQVTNKWEWDPESYIASLMLLKHLGQNDLYKKGRTVYERICNLRI